MFYQIILNNCYNLNTMEFSWIQRHALTVLLRHESARIKDMTPPDVAANLFSYHLDGLIAAKLIEKTARGQYQLTARGQQLAGKFSTLTGKMSEDIKTVVMLYAKVGEEFLLFRWSRQPYLGKVTPVYSRLAKGGSLKDEIHACMAEKVGAELPYEFIESRLIQIIHKQSGAVISHMNAYIYRVDIGAAALPHSSRNGTAFVAAKDESMMDGVLEMLQDIGAHTELVESVWYY